MAAAEKHHEKLPTRLHTGSETCRPAPTLVFCIVNVVKVKAHG
jgi:hypothetical protein